VNIHADLLVLSRWAFARREVTNWLCVVTFLFICWEMCPKSWV